MSRISTNRELAPEESQDRKEFKVSENIGKLKG